MTQKNLILSLFLDKAGHDFAGWRHPDADSDNLFTLDYSINLAKAAEAAKFDMVFLADALTLLPENNTAYTTTFQLEPIVLLSAIMAHTRHIGLTATVSTTYTDPYHVARKFASLNLLSRGRAAWNIVTSMRESEARNFNLEKALSHEARYERADEFVDVVKKLWRSWEPDALKIDRASGQFADDAKVRAIHHRGKHFSVEGALNVPSSAYGEPVLVQAGASGVGREFAARTADVIFASVVNREAGQAFYADIKQTAAKFGRNPDHIKILPGFIPVIGDTFAEAKEKKAFLESQVLPVAAIRYLSQWLETDLSAFDPDAPLPDIFDIDKIKGQKGRFQNIMKIANDDKLNLGQLAARVAATRTHHSMVGTPDFIADEMANWLQTNACDGFNVLPTHFPGGLNEFTEAVVPRLQSKGVFRTEYADSTLRGHLGIPGGSLQHR
jgi:FMN-dependent oxidoreductase (nitrilotriacetate monooxygenase family)